ncbi:hypothetical protein, partial [Sulfobacillus harzensis]|uniref:hypothetical protein n=1 Tax=Sulfobacillus harzensis TaxID=2729629 RepID=UPI001A9BA418
KFLFRHPGREVLFAPDVRDYSHKLLERAGVGAWVIDTDEKTPQQVAAMIVDRLVSEVPLHHLKDRPSGEHAKGTWPRM